MLLTAIFSAFAQMAVARHDQHGRCLEARLYARSPSKSGSRGAICPDACRRDFLTAYIQGGEVYELQDGAWTRTDGRLHLVVKYDGAPTSEAGFRILPLTKDAATV